MTTGNIYKRGMRQRRLRKAKEETWEEFVNEIESNYKENKKSFGTQKLEGEEGKKYNK